MSRAIAPSADPRQPQRGAADPTASVWVAASAGTGKTKVLTDRVLNLLLTGTAPERILSLTYTKAAAAEMNLRLAKELGGWAASDDTELKKGVFEVLGREPDDGECMRARQLFARVLDAPGGMKIQTIHAFCQSLLGRFPLEAGVPPHFSVVDERDQRELMAAARDEMLNAARQGGGNLAAALSRLTLLLHERGFAELMDRVTDECNRLRRCIDGAGSVEDAVARLRHRLDLADNDTPEAVIAAACEDGAFEGANLRRAAAALAEGSVNPRKLAAAIDGWLNADAADRVPGFADYARAFLTTPQGQHLPRPKANLVTKEIAIRRPEVPEIIAREAERVRAVELRRRAAETAAATHALLLVGDYLLRAYKRLKATQALLDFDDLIDRTVALLESDGGASWVLYKLDGGIDHVLIDEAQDTSPEQWRIVKALAGEFFAGEDPRPAPRTIFAVGDVKQSIFSFQGADPRAFVDSRDWFDNRVTAAGEIWRPISLETSFRSTRAVLTAVDAVFAADAARDGVAFDGELIVHQAWRREEGGMVEVWPTTRPRETDVPEPWRPPVEQQRSDSAESRLAHLVARRIERMVCGGEILQSCGRPVRAGDIMVLVRRRRSFVEELVRTLKELAIPVAGVDRMMITDQLAVMDLMAFGRFVLLPTDDLTLAAVLKSPLVGIDEEQLFRLCHDRAGKTLWAALRGAADNDPICAAAHRRLSELMAIADLVPPFEFYSRVLGPLRGRPALLERLGPDADDPIAEFMNLALQYERTHPPSLQGFLHWLTTTAVTIKRDLEQGDRNAVRVITVHGAKGLQAPVVILPDTAQVPKPRPSSLLWLDNGAMELPLWPPRAAEHETVAVAARRRMTERESQEYRRLLYVAMTRAADRLIVCGWEGKKGGLPDGCWYQLVRDGLEAAGEQVGLETCDDPFLASDADADACRVLRVVCPQEGPPKQETAASPAAAAPLPPWALSPPRPEPGPAKPLVPSRPDGEEPPVRAPFEDGDPSRFRRGRIIHRLLQSLPDVPTDRRRETAGAWLARTAHGLDSEAQAAILDEVLAVIDDPACRDVFGAGSQPEVPLTGVIGDRVLSGQVDRLLVAPAAITVLDYKTDRPPPQRAADVAGVYLRQMAAYRAALRSLYPDRPVCCLLLWTDGPLLMALDDALLDAHDPLAAAPR